MTGIRFRPAVPEDVGTIQAMLEALARQDGAEMRGSAAALLRYGFGALPLFQTVLAERGTKVLGLALFYPEFSTLRGRPGVHVQDLYLAPEARGLGLGAALLAQVMRAAQAWEAGYLTLMVDRGNSRARRFYASQGFAPRGDYEGLVLEGEALEAFRNQARA